MENISQKELLILNAIKNAGLPTDASYLGKQLGLAPASIDRILTELETRGLLTKVSNKGRILTKSGIEFLAQKELKTQKAESVAKLAAFTTASDKNTLLEILQVRKLLKPYAAEQACIL